MTTLIAHDDRVSWLPLVGIGCVSAYLVGFTWAMGNAEYDVWGAFLVLPILVVLSVPLVRRAARTEADPVFGQLIVLALITKLVGSLVLYALDQQLYDGSVDAEGYSSAGAVVAHQLHHGTWHQDGSLWGTPFVVLLTGLLFYVTGPTALGGFLVFSWVGFWGLFLFYRAFRIAVPHGDARRYATLLFFLPSLVFWSSSIGKEPWMTLSLGICAYGSARLLTDRRGGLLLVALGITMAAAVRPHIAPIPLLAITIAYLVRSRRSARRTPLRPLVTAMGFAVLIGGSVLAVSQAQKYLDLKSVDGQSIRAVVAESEKRSTDGGSTFDGHAVTSPLTFPQAFVTVLFRPLPTEAHNAQALAAAGEGTVLLVVFLSSAPRLAHGLRHLRRDPYVVVALATTCLFVYALSGYSNFGLLARHRVQVLPFLMVLLALPRPSTPAAQR